MKKSGIVAVAALALVLSACGGNAATPQTQTTAPAAGGGELKKVVVGALPIAPTAVIHLGLEKGFFTDNGLEVALETGQGGAALVPAVMSGTMHFGTGNPPSLLQARDKGFDIQVIASYTYDPAEGSHAILAKDGGPIASPKDLAGKTVAINTLKSMGDLLTMEAVEKDGGDPKAVKFVELGFPQMQAALETGQVDAVWTPEPFMSIIDGGAAHIVTHVGADTIKGHPTMMYFTSGDLIKSDPDMVAKMKKAINQSMDYAQEHPDEVRQMAVDKLKVNPDLAKTMILEDFGGPVRTEQVKAMGDLMTKFGFVSKPADVDGLLAGAKD